MKTLNLIKSLLALAVTGLLAVGCASDQGTRITHVPEPDMEVGCIDVSGVYKGTDRILRTSCGAALTETDTYFHILQTGCEVALPEVGAKGVVIGNTIYWSPLKHPLDSNKEDLLVEIHVMQLEGEKYSGEYEWKAINQSTGEPKCYGKTAASAVRQVR